MTEAWEILVLGPPGGGIRTREVAQAIEALLADRFPDVHAGLVSDTADQIRGSGYSHRRPVYAVCRR